MTQVDPPLFPLASDLAARQRVALVAIAGAQLLALSLWFSASAVADQLEVVLRLASWQVPWITLSVQVGFVVGALGSAMLTLGDRIPARRLFALSAVLGAGANLALLVLGPGDGPAMMALRFVTGAALAGVYPSGMKAIAGWFSERRGMALGVLIGALTVGSALPHLVRGVGLEWRGVLTGSSLLAVVAAGVMLATSDGPFEVPTSHFSWSHLRRVVSNRGFRLATGGYLGHMWELYAAWTWIAAYLFAQDPGLPVSVVTFGVIAVGGVGAWLAGRLADRQGRTLAAGGSMLISGAAAAATAVAFGLPGWVLVPVLMVWGFTVVADSAQFSAMVTEVVEGEDRGTALTLQTALGFLLTLGSIWLVPVVAELTSWRWAFWVLVPGPVLGAVAMARLRRSEWSGRLAGGIG